MFLHFFAQVAQVVAVVLVRGCDGDFLALVAVLW
jgi:hypothetical protein